MTDIEKELAIVKDALLRFGRSHWTTCLKEARAAAEPATPPPAPPTVAEPAPVNTAKGSRDRALKVAQQQLKAFQEQNGASAEEI
jgi:hypothetical protein